MGGGAKRDLRSILIQSVFKIKVKFFCRISIYWNVMILNKLKSKKVDGRGEKLGGVRTISKTPHVLWHNWRALSKRWLPQGPPVDLPGVVSECSRRTAVVAAGTILLPSPLPSRLSQLDKPMFQVRYQRDVRWGGRTKFYRRNPLFLHSIYTKTLFLLFLWDQSLSGWTNLDYF